MEEMNKLEGRTGSDAELILYYYGEAPFDTPAARAEMEQRLTESEELRANYSSLVELLQAVEPMPAPERDDNYGRTVWQQLAPKLAARSRWSWTAVAEWLAPRRLVLVGSVAALILVAFLAGRYLRPDGNGPEMVADGEVRERVLLVAVGEHLDRSQMVLVELANAQPNGPLDITAKQQRAEDLVAANRLYRQTATAVGETGVATLLEELERMLIEIANSPPELSGPQLERIQKRMEAQGILFKVRVVSSQVRERERAPLAPQKGQGQS